MDFLVEEGEDSRNGARYEDLDDDKTSSSAASSTTSASSSASSSSRLSTSANSHTNQDHSSAMRDQR